MPSDQHPPARHPNLPLDFLLAMDVDVGWRVGLTTLPGQSPPKDGFLLSDTDDVSAAFEAEFLMLVSDPVGLRELKEAVAGAITLRLLEIGSEFYIQDFGSSFYRISVCWDCTDKDECPHCNKTGFVTEVFRPHLLGLCSLKAVHDREDLLAGNPVNRSALLPPPPRPVRPPARRWLWTVPIAALATVAMAISSGLRIMYGTEAPSHPPPLARPALPAAMPSAAPPSQPSPTVTDVPTGPAVTEPKTAPLVAAPTLAREQPPAAVVPSAPAVGNDDDVGEPRRKPGAVVVRPVEPAGVPSELPATVIEKNWPVIRLQAALAQLKLYHGAVTGVLDEPTRQALTEFVAMVPPKIRVQYGTGVAAMAEAAVRREFLIKEK